MFFDLEVFLLEGGFCGDGAIGELHGGEGHELREPCSGRGLTQGVDNAIDVVGKAVEIVGVLIGANGDALPGHVERNTSHDAMRFGSHSRHPSTNGVGSLLIKIACHGYALRNAPHTGTFRDECVQVTAIRSGM